MGAGMAGVVPTVVRMDFDPTVQPTRGSFWVFLFLAVALALLMFSMVRHLRRADKNLSDEPTPAEGDGRVSGAGGPVAGGSVAGGSAAGGSVAGEDPTTPGDAAEADQPR